MRIVIRRPVLVSFLSVAAAIAFSTWAVAQDPAPSSEEQPPRSASEILSDSAEKAAIEKQSEPAEPPPPPADIEGSSAPQPTPAKAPEPADENSTDAPAEEAAEPAPAADEEPADGETPEATDAKLEAASFQGALPGQTTRAQLREKWGEPARVDRIPGGVRETYPSDAFEHVRVAIIEGVVNSVTLKLRQPMAVDAVVQHLQVGDVEPVTLFDSQGHPLGQAYPERGMMFGFATESKPPQVAQIVIDQISPITFLARAEARLPTRYAECRADLRQVLRLAPDNDRAYWLQAQVFLDSGDLEEAVASARKAIELDPKQLEYRLTLAKALSRAADHRHATSEAQEVAETPGAPALVLAHAHCCWGDCLAAAPERDYREAIKHHMQAMRLAEPLAKSAKPDLRRAAKQVLLESYLGAACDIGGGNWQQKTTIVPKWLDTAQSVADDLVEHDRGKADTRLRVYEAALSALAGVAEPPDATRWIDGAQKLGGVLVSEATDPGYKARLAWRLGVAFGDATEIETARNNPERALQLGNTAMAYFQQGESFARQLPLDDYVRGWLCYRMGAIHAVGSGDHQQAIVWFRHAVPLLEKPAPPAAAIHPARHGETFVSMAVSYWELGERDEALRLTEQGLKMMEMASADGHLEKAALAVPYGNLARMYEELGNTRAAKEFSELATRAAALGRK